MANAEREAADLQAMAAAEGADIELAAWDWSYYTEKVRAERYAFDASQLRPYFEMDNVLENGVFFAANRLYGLTFEERPELPVYHPDIRVWEVFDAGGEALGLFLGDFYARPSKRGGAWMNAYVSQSHLLETSPVVGNHLNVPKPPEGEPTLLTFDEVTTMFHEFGHALHGFFSDVRYPYFAGTSVPRDFVEYPSQVNEMWATWPEVLRNYAVHHETGEPMPADLLDKVLATQQFNQGFATTEYLAASLLDMAWHQLTAGEVPDAAGGRGIRGGGPRGGGGGPRDGAAALSQHLLLAHLEQRLLGRLLLLHLERGARRRLRRMVQGERGACGARTATTSGARCCRGAAASRRWISSARSGARIPTSVRSSSAAA